MLSDVPAPLHRIKAPARAFVSVAGNAGVTVNELGLEAPLLLKMRLGEGSGCPVMFRVLDAAYAIMNEMGTVEEGSFNESYLDEIRIGDNFTVKR